MKNIKLTSSLIRVLNRIEDNQFDEYDIKLLLIDIREFIREQTFLREIADFIAHPERNRGLCHKSINSRYAKMKMHKLGTEKLIEEKQFELHSNKPWSFFSDQILGFINHSKIKNNQFQLFVLDCLDDLSDSILINHYNLNKKDVKILLDKSYRKEEGYYVLKSNLRQQEFLLLDDLLKFIRGTILGKSVINQECLKNDLTNAYIKIKKELKLDSFKNDLIKTHFDSIMVCILSLMHDSKFKMYDDEFATAYLTFHKEAKNREPESFTLALMVKTPSFSFPIVTSSIDYQDFIFEYEVKPEEWDLKPIPWVFTKRENNKLRLIEDLSYQGA